MNVASSTQRSLVRVLPGNADSSYLYQMVASGRMPETGGALSSADLGLLREWINAGAANN